MGSLSNYAETAWVRHLLLQAAYTPASTLYLGLSTSDPGEAATGASASEVANSGSYARTAIAFGAASSRAITQNADVVFPAATGSWGTITHWFIVDTNTYGSGNVLASGAFNSSFAVVSGNQRTVASGQVSVSIGASGAGGGMPTGACNSMLDRMFRNQAFTVSANYVALYTTAPTDSAAGTEASGTSYARVQVNASGGASPAWNSESGGATDNANAINFPTPGGSWGNIKAASIMTASSSGTMLWWIDVTDQDVSTETTQIGFPAGSLDIAVT